MLHMASMTPDQVLQLMATLVRLGHWDLHLIKVAGTHVSKHMQPWSTHQLLRLVDTSLAGRMYHGVLYRRVAERFLQDTGGGTGGGTGDLGVVEGVDERGGPAYPFALRARAGSSMPADTSHTCADLDLDLDLDLAARQLRTVVVAYNLSHVKSPQVLEQLGQRLGALMQAVVGGKAAADAGAIGGHARKAGDGGTSVVPPHAVPPRVMLQPVWLAEMLWSVCRAGAACPATALLDLAAEAVLLPRYCELGSHVKGRLAAAYGGAGHMHTGLLEAMRADALALASAPTAGASPPPVPEPSLGSGPSLGSEPSCGSDPPLGSEPYSGPDPPQLAASAQQVMGENGSSRVGPATTPAPTAATAMFMTELAWWAARVGRLDAELLRAVCSYSLPGLVMTNPDPEQVAHLTAAVATACTSPITPAELEAVTAVAAAARGPGGGVRSGTHVGEEGDGREELDEEDDEGHCDEDEGGVGPGSGWQDLTPELGQGLTQQQSGAVAAASASSSSSGSDGGRMAAGGVVVCGDADSSSLPACLLALDDPPAMLRTLSEVVQRCLPRCSDSSLLQLMQVSMARLAGLGVTPRAAEAVRSVAKRVAWLNEARSEFRRSWRYHKMGFGPGSGSSGSGSSSQGAPKGAHAHKSHRHRGAGSR